MNFGGNAAFYLGEWRIDPALDEISRDGKTVKLEPRTMRVLVCFAERPGEVVSVNQLLDVVWKDLVVTPYSVYQAVAALRRALGDDPKDPTYIANVVRRGYRLVAPVEVAAQTLDPVRPQTENAVGTDQEDAQIPAKDKLERVAPGPLAGSHIVERRIPLRYGSILMVLLVGAGGVLWLMSRLNEERAAPAIAAVSDRAVSPVTRPAVPFDPPAHSIAVLPFVNMSGDPSQQYFSDGLTEELLNSLTRINELQVAARTSSFSFQGEHPDIATVAHKLNVASVLEGSVRRSGNTIRVTAQLNNAVTGFHLWSQTYDRDLGDILKLQTDIANAVASALKVTLLGNASAKIELGGTHNPAAFDAYLRAVKTYYSGTEGKDLQTAIDAYTDAIRLDPNYALAFAGRSRMYTGYATEFARGASIREFFDKAQADAREAVRLAPELAEGHLALGYFFEDGALDFTRANEGFQRALALAPGDATVLRLSGDFLVSMGQFDEGISAARRAVALDPLNRSSHLVLGAGLYFARRYREAIQAYADIITLDPSVPETYGVRGLAYYGLHDLKNARSSCESKPEHWESQWCLAVVYDKMGQHTDAEAVLAKYRAKAGDAGAYEYATIYAQWGDRAKALEWLATAMRLRDPGLVLLKTDPLMDPMRNEPGFQAIERQLKFPS
jgi:TolB-like protein/DNA-binding winged helix-turn-helix (wHTH) protein/cytochrome c-type biogenesis protein CcmH/NrfG